MEILPLHHPLKEIMVVMELILVVLTLVVEVVEPLHQDLLLVPIL